MASRVGECLYTIDKRAPAVHHRLEGVLSRIFRLFYVVKYANED